MPSVGQRCEGQRLGRRPSRAARSPSAICAARFERASSILRMRMEVVRQLGQLLAAARQSRSRGTPVSTSATSASAPPAIAVPDAARALAARARSPRCVRAIKFALQLLAPLVGDLVGLFPRHAAQLEQVLEIALAHALALLDRLVQQRLREATARRLRCGRSGGSSTCRSPRRAGTRWRKSMRQAHDLGHGLGIFAVDVEDRDLQHLGHVGGVGAASGLRAGAW